jgi:2-polyprenyl-3-methyl-5-hydroxy-6-metoxy-1,4-benzoquinol methylase
VGAALKHAVKRALIAMGLLPSRYLWRNPFKIIEFEELLAGASIAPSDEILDIGCGSGPQDLLLARKARRVIGIDVSPDDIERAKILAATYARGRAIEYRCTPIERAGFARNQFDKIVSFSVFEHIVNREEVLRVMAEVLKPGGQLLLSTDSMATMTDRRLIEKHRTDHFVQTYFTADELRTLLDAHGFADIRIRPIFRGPYALKVFEAALDRGLAFGRYAKFWPLLRIKLEEIATRHRDAGLFLCASAVKPG